MQADNHPPLVSCDWLAERLDWPEIVVLDASFFLPNQQRNPVEEYRQAHVPGARFFDIDEVADKATHLPHMLPNPQQFADAVGVLGVGNDTHIVVYDSNFFMASARLWWTFRVFGHDRISVLDGGLARWKAEGRPLTVKLATVTPRRFDANFRPQLVRDLEQIKALLKEAGAQILDARSPGRFAGIEPEPRAGLRSGHIPGSFNLFFKNLIDETTYRLKSPGELEGLYRAAGIDARRPVVTTCGTGVTASILALGLYCIANENAAVYDGSWTEWGGRGDTPVSRD
ncbi:MAG TPA: 3-mercaptopyruvate sulfurtransferase [Methylococcaceae bacterium]|jgi:thiosulfate/3-mercaptopyruvate sulfurtransferase|nr:3-mercaptopyruvate sulfurtransferase [Methylococcaceae bacterium]